MLFTCRFNTISSENQAYSSPYSIVGSDDSVISEE